MNCSYSIQIFSPQRAAYFKNFKKLKKKLVFFKKYLVIKIDFWGKNIGGGVFCIGEAKNCKKGCFAEKVPEPLL